MSESRIEFRLSAYDQRRGVGAIPIPWTHYAVRCELSRRGFNLSREIVQICEPNTGDVVFVQYPEPRKPWWKKLTLKRGK